MTEGNSRQPMQVVWRKRASRLSQRTVLATAGQASPVMVVGIGDERYGIDLPDVAEVLPQIQATAVPGAPAIFSGVINVHGEIRPVMDLKRLLGITTVRNGNLSRVILLRSEGREMGLRIDSVEQIRWVGLADLQWAENGDPGSSQHNASKHIKGMTKDLLMLLSTEALFAELHTGVTA